MPTAIPASLRRPAAGRHRLRTRARGLRRFAGLALAVAALGGTASAGATAEPAPHALPLDARALAEAPEALRAIAAQWIPRDADGLLGRSRAWGAMYSPRFQMGAGRALRIALADGRLADAGRAFTALNAGAQAIGPDGQVPSRVPLAVSGGATPGAGDIASAAAFFLGDACLGLLALQAHPQPAAVAAPQVLAQARAALVRGVQWLQGQAPRLLAADRQAPNRLLFNARSFQACGVLAGDTALAGQAAPFVSAALALQHTDGHFLERGGWDTHYQAVALSVGVETLMAGHPRGGPLDEALARAATWLARRVDPQGAVDTTGSTRTCAGGESFLGTPKLLSLPEVVWGLLYAGQAFPGLPQSVPDAGQRVARWARAHPGAGRMACDGPLRDEARRPR